MGWKIAALMICSFAMGSLLTDIHNLKVHTAEYKTLIASLDGLMRDTDRLVLAAELRRKLDVANEKLACAELHAKGQAK